MKRLVLPLVLGLLVAPAAWAVETLPAPVLAPPGTPAAPPEWYGWQILAFDGAAAAAYIGALHASLSVGRPLAVGAIVAFEVGGPVLHGIHGRRDAIPTSILLRLAAPVLGLYVAFRIVEACDAAENGWHCSVGAGTSLTLALGLPLALASVIDARRASTSATPTPLRPRALAWAPTLAPATVGAGATLGLVGLF